MIKSIKEIITSRNQDFEHSLPQHGILYFDLLDAELRSKPSQPIDQDFGIVIIDIRKKRQEHSLTWNDLYTFDLIVTRLLPPERLSREVWSLRARYRDVADLRECEAYLSSKPPDLGGQVEEKQRFLSSTLYNVAIRMGHRQRSLEDSGCEPPLNQRGHWPGPFPNP